MTILAQNLSLVFFIVLPHFQDQNEKPELLFREIFIVKFCRTLLGSDPSDPKMSLTRVPNDLLDVYMIYLRCVDSVTARKLTLWLINRDHSEIFECTEDPTPPPITFSGSIVHAFSLPCSQPSWWTLILSTFDCNHCIIHRRQH